MRDNATNAGPDAGCDEVWQPPETLQALADDGCGSLIAELIAMFRTDTDTRLRALDDAVVKGDFPLVRKQVHSIKGSASQLGASKVAAICLQIETSGPEVFNQDLPAKLQALRAAYAHITNAMQASPLCVGGA